MSLEKLMAMNGAPCPCGRAHRFHAQVLSGPGVMEQVPETVKRFGAKKVYLLSDCHTWPAAGARVAQLLEKAGIGYVSHCFRQEHLEPDETSVGSAVMHFDWDCDLVMAVGSGVLNDIGKTVAAMSKLPYIIVATAPSMDGYASATSSMTRDGLKISLPTKGADVIIGDTDILRQAPLKMMKAGLGDMLAKYISICEWRMAHVIVGEYYCEEIAGLVRDAVSLCVREAQGLLERRESAVRAVFEGLVITGVAMNYAGMSRPASGTEHYISHCLDMRGVEFGIPVELHGIQCAVGTYIAAGLYEKLLTVTPDREKALAAVAEFDREAWFRQLRDFLGRGADSMIALEEKEKKYGLARHGARLEIILEHWQALMDIVRQEVPKVAQLEQLMDSLGMEKSLADLGAEDCLQPLLLRCTKDIRDKYVLPRLCWDLGIMDEILGEQTGTAAG